MSGGANAKKGFRYQDLCAMYFALDEFKKDPSFEHIYCEQEKMDFEIWSTNSFAGFQVKTRSTGLTAKETNDIFLYYLNKSVSSGKKKNGFWFVFGDQPIKSIGHLFTAIRNGVRGVRYTGQVKKYLDTALKDIPIESFSLDFHFLSNEQVERMTFSVAAEILKQKLGAKEDIPTEVVRNFVARFKDEIDKISCSPKKDERIYTTVEIGSLIDPFLTGIKIVRFEQQGNKKIEIKLPDDESEYTLETHVVIKKLPIESIQKSNEGNPIKR